MKALLTTLAVALLMLVARRLGGRTAGWLAGLPTITGPALLWLAWQSGTDAAVAATVGCLAGCAGCAVFAVVFARLCARCPAALTLLASTAALCAVLPLLAALEGRPAAALAAAVLACFGCRALMPRRHRPAGSPALLHAAGGDVALTAGCAGLVGAAVGLAMPQLGAFWAGVLASPPLVAAALATLQVARDGPASAQRFLDGYASGLIGRIVFAVAFGLLVPWLPVVLAFAVAVALGCSTPGRAWSALARAGRRAGAAA